MANNSQFDRKNFEKKFSKYRRKRKYTFEGVKEEEETSYFTNVFPLVVIFLLFVVFGIFYFVFNYYKEAITVDSDGYFISNNNKTLILGTKKNNTDDSILFTTNVSENDVIYVNALNHYLNNDKTKSVNIEYPLFINDGISIINYNTNVNLLDNNFYRSEGYSGLLLSYGKAYDTYSYNQIDNETYLLLSYQDNVMINLFDLKIKTTANEYNIPTNSFVYFEKNKISYFERREDTFVYNEINDIDLNSNLIFYYDGEEKEYTYSYEDFLDGIGTVYVSHEKPADIVDPDKQKEKKEKKIGNKTGDASEGEIVWQKPTVKVENLEANVFSITGDLTINDPASVIVKAPTFTVYKNNKTYLKRMYYMTGGMTISGLAADTTFTVVGQYTYEAEDKENNIVVTFYSGTFTTKSLDSLNPIDLSFNNGNIYSKKIEITDLKVASDINDEALNGVSKVSIKINNKDYYLVTNQVSNVINGIETTVATSESLNSSSTIDYDIMLYDKEGHSLKTTNNSGQTRTSKKEPTVSLRVIKSEVDEVTIGITTKNDDEVDLVNYRYIIKTSDGKTIKEDSVSSNRITLSDLDPDQLMNISLYADIDIDDGNGTIEDKLLSSMDFTSKPITSLGYINLKMQTNDITSSSSEIKYSISDKKTDAKLIKLLQEIKFQLYDENEENLINEISVTGEDLTSIKSFDEGTIKFSNLDSNTKYKLVVKTIVKQGSTSYELDTTQGLDEFITNKKQAIINITNSFTTETMIDFDVMISDVDGSIQSNYVRLELRDKDNKIKDTRTIAVNGESVERITYNNLNTNEFYNLYFYADEYNETRLNSTYQAKYLVKQLSLYTESGISGKIELTSSLRIPNGQNIADVKSEAKWIETTNYYTVPKTVDDEGNLHIYSKNGASSYMYDLSDYHEQIVTVSFSMKTITPVNEAYKVYFSQYMTGTTSSSYSKELTGLSTDSWKSYSYTFVVGSYNSINNLANVAYPNTSTYYGKYYTDVAGFYITGGTAVMSEYVIKDFEIHVQYDREEYDYGNVTLEQGNWNTNTDVSKAKTNSNYYVRTDSAILLEGGHRYSFNFNNDTNYTIYAYVFNKNGKYEKAYGWNYNGMSIYVAEDKYVRFVFRYRGAAGTINPEDITNFDIYQYTNNNLTGNSEFTYDLVTKVKTSVYDKRDEIPDNDYYIKIYENDVEVKSYRYTELVDTNTIENVIKEIELDEDKEYVVELAIKIRDRYYSLSNFEISTEDEVIGISTNNDWVFIAPYGNYILLNDLDFKSFTDQRLGWGNRYFYGTIDFQGYSIHQYTAKEDGTSNTSFIRFYRIEQSAVLKNLVLDIDINNQELNNSIYGLVEYNYGTIENVIINITDTHNSQMPQYFYGLLAYYNGINGKIRNFVVHLNGDLHMYASSAIVARENYGLIENGYMYGGNVIVDYNLTSGSNRQLGLIQRYGGVKSKINRVYSTISYEFPNNNTYDIAGLFAYETYGEISNSYVYGETNPLYPANGPYSAYERSTTRYTNVHYMSDNIYTSSMIEKASLRSLYDTEFQHNVLGDAFNIDELVELGYYPQVKFSTNKMPSQEYVELPTIDFENPADIIFMDVEEKGNDTATIKVTVDNQYGEEVTDITIADLKTQILSQTFEDGKSYVMLKVSEPSVFVSKYQVRSISTMSTNGYTSTRKYDLGEKYLLVDFYKEITTVEEFIKINNGLNQNYILMNDLDFNGYSEFYINNYSGKFDGNNYSIKNVRITKANKSGLFNQMNGTMQNVVFENIYISKTSSYHGIVGYSNQYAKYYNVHIKNMTIEIPETATTDSMYIGSLVGYANSSMISYSSVNKVTITSEAKAAGITVGGLIGNANGLVISNSFASNVDITVKNAISTNGVGGFLGREQWSSYGSIDSCYSTGKINTSVVNTGGLVGQSLGYINNSYSSVDVSSDMSYVGGISGSSRQNKDAHERNLYVGNIYSSSTDSNIHRITGNYTSSESNYALSSGLINGSTTTDTNGETLVTYNDLLNSETYENILGNNYDYSSSSEGILPKLYAADGITLLPNQEDTKLFVNKFNVNKMVMDKHADYATIVLYLDNPDHYTITDIEVENASVEITRNAMSEDISVLEFKITPEKYFDTYKISTLKYLDSFNNEITLERNIRIDATFYKQLRSFEDWQNVSTYEAENYILANDIDFSGKTNINTKVMFNRLETAGDDIYYSLKNLDLTYTKNSNYNNLIQKVSTSIKNIVFDNITINDETKSGNSYQNIIMYTYGKIEGVTFKNITINAPKKYYVSSIGRNYANTVKDITLDNITVNGYRYVSSFISIVEANINDNFDNINANDIHINSTSYSTGGVFAHFNNSVSYQDKPIYNNINIKDSEVISTSYYVGGISGYGDANNSTVDNVHVKGSYYVGGAVGYQRGPYQYNKTVKNSTIEGTSYYIGGVYGYSYLSFNDYLISSDVKGLNTTTYGVGGIAGYKSNWSYMYRSGVIDSNITNAGDRTGGLVGYFYYSSSTGYIYASYITDSNVTGNTRVGGLVGTATAATYIAYSRVSNTNVTSNDVYAGGVAGYFDNNNNFGAHNEGYVDQVSIENSNIQAKTYAGGIFGGMEENPYYGTRIRRIYFSGSVKATDYVNYGIGSGDEHNMALITQPKIYFYENSTINDVKLSSLSKNESVSSTDLLSNVTFYPGYINNGVPSYNENDVNATYSDYIKLEKGKSYQIQTDYLKSSDTYRVYLYNNQKTYVSSVTSSSVDQYIGSYYSTSYNNLERFKVYKDCYIRINVINKTQLKEITLKEINATTTPISSDRLLSAGDLREKLTWVYNIGNTSAINSSKLNYSSSYWDTTVLNNSESITVNDKTNNISATGKVSSISSNGAMFDGTTNNSYLEVNDFTLPNTGNLTLSTKFRVDVSWPYQSIFSSKIYSKRNNGFGLFVHYQQLYVWVYNSYYSTGYYLPMNEEVDVSVVYETVGSKRSFKVYVNGNLVYTHNSPSVLKVNSEAKTYIGWDEYYAPMSTSYRFVGLIKNVMLYDRALTIEEIQNNINSSSGITDNSGLKLHYDFTNSGVSYDAYYPIVKWSSTAYTVDNQRLNPLPTGNEVSNTNGSYTSSNLLTTSLSNNYYVYSSGIDTINLEFENITNDLSFTYKINGETYTKKVEDKVYSLVYDYQSDAEIIIKNTYEEKVIKITPEEYSRKINYYDDKFYYIKDNSLYESNNKLLDNVLHIYNNMVLLKGNRIYNIDSKNITNYISSEGILSTSIPLMSSILEDKIIKTYYTFTMSNNEEIDYQIFIKDKDLFVFNSTNTLNDNIVYNKYNLEEYQIILNDDYTISSYKGSINYPSSFVNSKIKQISGYGTVLFVLYESGTVLGFDYITGEELYRSGSNLSFSLFEYINVSLSNDMTSLSNTSSSYSNSKSLIESLLDINDTSINDTLNSVIDTNNNTSNKLSSEYINVYNNSTNKYEVYNVNELLTTNKVDTSSESESTVTKTNTKTTKEVKTVNDKLKSDNTLYNYFINKETKSDISDKKGIIYTIILSIVVINLFILSYIYSKKEV